MKKGNDGIWGSMKDWMSDPRREKGVCKEQIDFIRSLREIDDELGRVTTLTYFLLTRLKMEDARSMMRSAKNQRNLIWALTQDLKKYQVSKKWMPIFKRDISKLSKRAEFVYGICKEDLRLTKHWPYFSEVGFDKLLDFQTKFESFEASVLDVILPEMESWERDHQEEIQKHMESIADEIRIRDEHRAKVKEKERQEKEAAKRIKAEEKAEIREIEKNRKEELKRKRKLDREFERYFR